MKTNHNSYFTKLFFRKAYAKRVSHFFHNLESKKVLDIGAGFGHLTYVANEMNAIVDAIEPREECFDVLDSLNCNRIIRSALLPDLLEKDRYDIAIMISVLDEVEDKYNFLNTVIKSLKVNGRLLIEVRNTKYFPMLRNSNSTDITESEYVRLFESLGLTVIEKLGVSRPLTFGSVNIFLKTCISNFINHFVPNSHCQMLIFYLKVI